MADTKISALTELTAPVDADLLAIVDDPAGTPITKKITRRNFLGLPQVMYNILATVAPICSLYTDDRDVMIGAAKGAVADMKLRVSYPGTAVQMRQVTSDWADVDQIVATVKVGQYIYALLRDTGATPDTWRVYRYDYTNLAAGGTQMSFSGVTLTAADTTPYMTTDGTNFYFAYDANNSANVYVLRKCSVSGTTFTSVSSITCGSSATGFDAGHFQVTAAGNIYTYDTANDLVTKYNSSGTQQYIDDAPTYSRGFDTICNVEDQLYLAIYATTEVGESSGLMVKLNYS